jgi:hypothetical protein
MPSMARYDFYLDPPPEHGVRRRVSCHEVLHLEQGDAIYYVPLDTLHRRQARQVNHMPRYHFDLIDHTTVEDKVSFVPMAKTATKMEVMQEGMNAFF